MKTRQRPAIVAGVLLGAIFGVPAGYILMVAASIVLFPFIGDDPHAPLRHTAVLIDQWVFWGSLPLFAFLGGFFGHRVYFRKVR